MSDFYALACARPRTARVSLAPFERYALAEREHFHRASVVEFDTVSERSALYERIADRLRDLDRPLPEDARRDLERLLAEPPPVRDYGLNAVRRNERIAAVLAELEGD